MRTCWLDGFRGSTLRFEQNVTPGKQTVSTVGNAKKEGLPHKSKRVVPSPEKAPAMGAVRHVFEHFATPPHILEPPAGGPLLVLDSMVKQIKPKTSAQELTSPITVPAKDCFES